MKKYLLFSFTVFVLTGTAFAQTSVKPVEGGPAKVNNIVEHIKYIESYIKESVENRKMANAIDAERAKIPAGETRAFEIVTRNGPISQGGEFVRVQEVKDVPKISAAGEHAGPTTIIGGGLPLSTDQLTAAQKQEMAAKAEALKKEEQTLKDAEAAQKAMQDAHDAAEKAKADLAAQQVAAAEAAQRAKVEAANKAAAEKRARDAERAERQAERDGARVQEHLRQERERFQREGGNYRMPA